MGDGFADDGFASDGFAAHGCTVDCAECVMRDTAACEDCVVTFVVNREPGTALVIDVAEARAMRMLSRAGLVPELRHLPRRPDGRAAGEQRVGQSTSARSAATVACSLGRFANGS